MRIEKDENEGGLVKRTWDDDVREEGTKNRGAEERGSGNTHCLAARIICAFLSLRLASRFSADSSQGAFPPGSAVVGAGSASRWLVF